MASLNFTIPGINSVPSYFSDPWIAGFEMVITGATTFTIAPGGCRAYTNDWTIQYPTIQPAGPEDITVDVSTVGPMGCYPFAIPTVLTTVDTSLPVYVLGDTSGALTPTVIVATGKSFLLQGYNSFRRISTVYIQQSSGNLIPMTQSGNYKTRRYQLATPLVAVTAGAAVTATPIILDALALPVPQYATMVFGNMTLDAGTLGDSLSLSDTATGGSGQVVFTTSVGSVAATVPYEIAPVDVLGDATIYYYVTSAGDAATIGISGWEEDLTIEIL